jgi:hypothetical protein
MLKGYHCGNAQHNVLFGTPVRKTDYLVPGIVIWNGLLPFGLLDLGLKSRLLACEFDFKAKPCA